MEEKVLNKIGNITKGYKDAITKHFVVSTLALEPIPTPSPFTLSVVPIPHTPPPPTEPKVPESTFMEDDWEASLPYLVARAVHLGHATVQ